MDFRIVIPSYKRGRAPLPTLENMPTNLLDKVILLVHPDEKAIYLSNFDVYSRSIRVETYRGQGQLSKVRHYIFNTLSKHEGVDCIVTLDDDLTFFKRANDMKLKPATPSETLSMINRCVNAAMREGYFACGISSRQGNNHVLAPFVDNSRMMTGYAVNCVAYRKEKMNISRIPLKQDFWLTLSMLTLGYKNRVLYNFCWNQRGSNADGGCAVYRTERLMKESAEILQEAFPECVTIVTKHAKVWKGMEERTDVRIQWKKAYDLGVSQREMGI